MIIMSPRSVNIVRMDERDLNEPGFETFDCGNEVTNTFFKTECYNEQQAGLNVTYILYYNGQLAAFVSICADTLTLTEEERGEEFARKIVPALKIAQLGRDLQFRELQFGRVLVNEMLRVAFNIYDAHLGIRYVTLDAIAGRVEYYESLGFTVNTDRKYTKKNAYTSMRRDILAGLYEE
ncbi:GNAT family N-acetyltransferase [Paenibacillus hunanensis]|uniref:GNAT family N-acetyltransferase n=1 Tax=Paenibacillus hunanensis TaxID=539262 RepID=UPI002025C548|nr:GNAT family N-acetyltransferase [Paenibacillus hunanensis]MCL9662129.1 GNAT family N-acetyltransferase [Paenibacillus hunanensis]